VYKTKHGIVGVVECKKGKPKPHLNPHIDRSFFFANLALRGDGSVGERALVAIPRTAPTFSRSFIPE
jgi:hypothetical protein